MFRQEKRCLPTGVGVGFPSPDRRRRVALRRVFHVGIEPSTAAVGHPADEGKLSAEKPWGAVLGRWDWLPGTGTTPANFDWHP